MKNIINEFISYIKSSDTDIDDGILYSLGVEPFKNVFKFFINRDDVILSESNKFSSISSNGSINDYYAELNRSIPSIVLYRNTINSNETIDKYFFNIDLCDGTLNLFILNTNTNSDYALIHHVTYNDKYSCSSAYYNSDTLIRLLGDAKNIDCLCYVDQKDTGIKGDNSSSTMTLNGSFQEILSFIDEYNNSFLSSYKLERETNE